jgi:nucleoside-diphosphate-sugar epimerase
MPILADGLSGATGPSGTGHVVVTGSTGYIGSHVVAALRVRGAEVTPLDRSGFGDDRRRAEAFATADAVVHCVSAVSGDPATIRAANVDAARAVAETSRVTAMGRIVAVSTAAVTGNGPHRGASGATARRPTSSVSRARAEGERILFDAGAVIVRPNIVWGAGDRWVVPTLARIVAATGGVPPTWDALVSVVGVRDLADGLAGLATTTTAATGGPVVLHADAPGSFPIAAMATWIRDRIVPSLAAVASPPMLSDHQRSMLEVDNWFDGSAFWRAASVPPPEPFSPLEADAAWYREFIGSMQVG